MQLPHNEGGAQQSARKRVLIVDDHMVLRHGLTQLINREEDMMVCGEAPDAAGAVQALDHTRPDVVIVDISLPGMSGIEFIKNARATHPDLPMIVFSMHEESLYGGRALKAGALAYLKKDSSRQEIIAALRSALNGAVYTNNAPANQPQPDLPKNLRGGPGVSKLSDRELEVFELIGQGKSTREISQMLNLSIKTIDSHRLHIKEKLGIATATQLVQHAVLHVSSQAGTAAPADKGSSSV